MAKISYQKIYSAQDVSKLFGKSLRTVQRIARKMGKKKGAFGTLYFDGEELKRIAVGR